MRIAVLLPYKNAEKTIGDTLRSLKNQTYKNFVLFAVNNSSSDDSYNVVLGETLDKIETVHLHCYEDGIVPTLNTGLFNILSYHQNDHFDAVARLDADDIWLPEKLEKQVQFLKDHPEISIVGTQILMFENDPLDCKKKMFFPFDHNSIMANMFMNCNVIAHPSVLVRSEVYSKIGVYEDIYQYAEDYQFWLKASKYFKFANLEEYLVKYKINNNPNNNPIVPVLCRENYGKMILSSGRIPTENKSKIGLLIIATKNYTRFLQLLISSADRFFLKDKNVEYFVFTDMDIDIHSSRPINVINVEHKEWPWMTLGRYKIFSDNSEELSKMDYLYYCDADMMFCGEVGTEIFSLRTATQHPGYYGKRGTPETNPDSLAYISPKEEMQYFAGGFNGGTASEFLKMSKKISANIEKDFEKGLIAVWHDESHLNRYFVDNPPTKILDPSYCHPESWDLPFKKRLLALDKDHREIRKECENKRV